jgi:toxin YoeB
MKNILFSGKAYEEFIDWAEADFDNFEKINRLIKDISRSPFKGLGKPEPLKHQLKGYWSRRITEEHRLIYKLEDDIIKIISMKGHYD